MFFLNEIYVHPFVHRGHGVLCELIAALSKLFFISPTSATPFGSLGFGGWPHWELWDPGVSSLRTIKGMPLPKKDLEQGSCAYMSRATLAWLIFWINFGLYGTVLCIVGCSSASLGSRH